jgi:predicted ATPase
MGDLFIESGLEEGSGNRFILESHSEHLMLRLLRRIREYNENDEDYPDFLPPIKPSDLSVYYIQSKASKTEMVKLRVSEDGDFLDRWPNGFFDERAEELF